MTKEEFSKLSRRELMRLGGSAFVMAGAALRPQAAAAQQSYTPNPNNPEANVGCGVGTEPVPLSPIILDAFTEDVPVPSALAPVRNWSGGYGEYPTKYMRSNRSYGDDDYTHQLWCDQLGLPYPNLYRIALQVAPHRITNGRVQYLAFQDGLPGSVNDVIDVNGTGAGRRVVTTGTPENLPFTAMTAFSGTPDIPHSATFPGPMINAEYGRPNLVRFINQLDRDGGMDLQDFGDPERGFLTHLHNAHTACESDGNPLDTHHQYCPGEWCDNLYHNYPAGNDPTEMQSFLWFHDHTHGHTGANVYKGMAGLYPIYDPKLDPGDERSGLRLPGVRVNRADGAFDVKYDIPLALYDCLIDDGVTPHQDFHNGCGETHPEWKGKLFFRHYPNHGFVGDVFTVNCKAYPVLKVKRRKYRLRFLGASIARIYELAFMHAPAGHTVKAVPGLQGQYAFVDNGGVRRKGTQVLQPLQIASEGGLLPRAVPRNTFEIWPANRKEFIVDFTKLMDGSPTKAGDVIWLCNLRKMKNGRKPNDNQYHMVVDSQGREVGLAPDPEWDPNYCVPIMKIVIEDSKLENDNSLIPKGTLRNLPTLPKSYQGVRARHFALARRGGSTSAMGESEWIINGLGFDEWLERPGLMPRVKVGSGELWVLRNQSGSWVHPMHMHQEEHQVVARFPAGTVREDTSNILQALKSAPRFPMAPDQPSKEDVANLGPSEELVVFRKFRTYIGDYVAHCHNRAHEDHSMMFTWCIDP